MRTKAKMSDVKTMGLALGAALGFATLAEACAFHGYTPRPTLVDRLLATEHVVLARPGEGTSFQVTETLLGPDINQMSLTAEGRAPTGPSLIARDEAYGPWIHLAPMDARLEDVVRHVLARQSAWQLGNEAKRLNYFTALINDPSPQIRRLALQELDRASYRALRRARLPAVIGLRADLAAKDEDLQPIRVLLAGLSGDARFAQPLAEGLEQAISRDTPYLGAYATALIELQGREAVAYVVQKYLSDGRLPDSQRDKLLEALALQGKTGAGVTRRAITREMALLVRKHPELRDAVAAQFGPASRWN